MHALTDQSWVGKLHLYTRVIKNLELGQDLAIR